MMRDRNKPVILFCDDGSEKELATYWEICGHCRGDGTSSAYLGAFTGDEWREMDSDWQEDYLAGRFDRACESCGGSGKGRVGDWSRLSSEDAAVYEAQLQDDREYDAMCAAERRYGC